MHVGDPSMSILAAPLFKGGSFKGDRDRDIDVEVDVDIDGCFPGEPVAYNFNQPWTREWYSGPSFWAT